MKVIRTDRPKGYITRITEGKALQVATDITKFGENVLPVLVQVYCLKLLVKDTFESVKRVIISLLTTAIGWIIVLIKHQLS